MSGSIPEPDALRDRVVDHRCEVRAEVLVRRPPLVGVHAPDAAGRGVERAADRARADAGGEVDAGAEVVLGGGDAGRADEVASRRHGSHDARRQAGLGEHVGHDGDGEVAGVLQRELHGVEAHVGDPSQPVGRARVGERRCPDPRVDADLSHGVLPGRCAVSVRAGVFSRVCEMVQVRASVGRASPAHRRVDQITT